MQDARHRLEEIIMQLHPVLTFPDPTLSDGVRCRLQGLMDTCVQAVRDIPLADDDAEESSDLQSVNAPDTCDTGGRPAFIITKEVRSCVEFTTHRLT